MKFCFIKKNKITKDTSNKSKLTIKILDDHYLLDTLKKIIHNFEKWNFKTMKIQNMFQNFNFSRVLYHILYVQCNVHDV